MLRRLTGCGDEDRGAAQRDRRATASPATPGGWRPTQGDGPGAISKSQLGRREYASSAHGGMGQRGLLLPRAELADEEVVHGRPDQLDDLVLQVLVDGTAAAEGIRRLGAPPVELVAALAPVAPLPLPQRSSSRDRGRRCAPRGGAGAASRRPASSRAAAPGLQRGDVQRAPHAALEPGAVEEDAGAVDHPGRCGRRPRRCRRCRPACPSLGAATGPAVSRAAAASTAARSSSSTKWAP